jgi:hypothetical protein
MDTAVTAVAMAALVADGIAPFNRQSRSVPGRDAGEWGSWQKIGCAPVTRARKRTRRRN